MSINQTINPVQLVCDTFDHTNRIIRERCQCCCNDLALTKEITQDSGITPHATLIRLVDDISGTLTRFGTRSELMFVRHYQSVTRPE